MCKRCEWGTKNELMIQYHDTEWGVPLHDDKKLFEFLVLEGFQAGLSWQIVLNKREAFRKAFDNFNPDIIANYNQDKIDELLQDSSIIRNKLKINGCVNNAKCFLDVQKEFGSFDRYIWGFVNNKPIVNRLKTIRDMPTTTPLSDEISKDLKKRGFKFVGSTVIYSHLQATGVINDHLITCYRYKEILDLF
ncbi:DNA-3-methyladenine glycosylase I [Maribellus comscasis]|uniref:DNA-3-methyladenine glycosylase I n=1 Tax=Maribellus comscasis TaxID=2681766 RepID=A0A6I6JIT7_9BACT|nr:DNA-3-methyladenine glycosylase I [Maribellus comscasis]QGY42656.1 DNA-3-methyladenine glycosylase I [Maribellus comscasis]